MKRIETNGRPSKYDWNKILRKSQILREGTDFVCAMHGMVQQIRNKAAKRGVNVSIRVEGMELHLNIRKEKHGSSRKK